jgi:SAM-dependent methyltransferase
MSTSIALQPAGLEADVVGAQTLEMFHENQAYSRLLWQCLARMAKRPIQGRVLEVGCGIGTLTQLALQSRGVEFLHAIDVEPAYLQRIKSTVTDARLRTSLDRAEAFRPAEYCQPGGQFDFIYSSNVLEHIKDHVGVLKNLRSMLAPGGVVLLLVPAHPWLCCELDRGLSHFRRYSKRSLAAAAHRAGLRPVRMRHFNPIGALGWWLNGKLGKATLSARQVSLYNRFAIPLSRIVDRLNPFPLGVSLLAALEADDDVG